MLAADQFLLIMLCSSVITFGGATFYLLLDIRHELRRLSNRR